MSTVSLYYSLKSKISPDICAKILCHAFFRSFTAHCVILINNDCACMWVCVTKLKAAAQLSGDTEVQPIDEATVSPIINPEERKKILDSQYKCFEKMNRDPPYNKSGSDNVYWNSVCLSVTLFLCEC